MDIRRVVGKNVRRYRIEAELSQEELAAGMGVEQGLCQPSGSGEAQSHDCHDLARSGGVGRSSGRIVSGACSDSKAQKDPKADYPNIIRGCGRRGEIRSALDLLEAQEQFDPPDLSSRLKRIPGRGGGEFQISNIGAET
jgi:hypothetical protein